MTNDGDDHFERSYIVLLSGSPAHQAFVLQCLTIRKIAANELTHENPIAS